MGAAQSSDDKYEVYRYQGLGGSLGIGRRCALVLVDFVNGFQDPTQLGGPHVQAAVEATVTLLEAFRRLDLPIVFTRVVFEADGSNANAFSARVPALLKLTEASLSSHIVPTLAPKAGEWVICKQGASAFFETGLAAWLRYRDVDTVVVVGCTTSGCVRATAVDAMQHNFSAVVLSDCVGDRAVEPHEANLFDIEQKYADVMTRDEFLAHLERSTRNA
ncbi:MAG: isochorismatase family protein [Pigmentiphaga sp.]